MTTDRNSEGFAELRKLGDDVPEIDETAKARARVRLDAAIERERAAPRTSPGRWGTVAAAVVAVALATSLIVRGSATRPPASPALLQLAAVASTQPSPAVPAGSFVYMRSRVRATSTDVDLTTGGTKMVVVTSRRETWIATDGSGLILERPVQPVSGPSKRISAAPGELRFPSLDQFPTEPEALLDEIMARPGFLDDPADDFEVLSGIGALLRDAYVDPPHRRALFLIVESIDGIDVVEGYRDPLGRPGTALSLRNGDRSVTLVFEPRTSRLLEEDETHEGGAFSEATYLETGIVSAIGKRPGEPGA
jgi:hypothetical protein